MVSCTEVRLPDGCLIRAKRPVAANTVQASPAGEALLAVESSAMFVLIGSAPHTALLAGQIPPDGKGFELQKYVRNRPSGRLRYRCSYFPPGELVDVGGTELHTLLITPTRRALRAGRPFVRRPVYADVCRPVLRRGCGPWPWSTLRILAIHALSRRAGDVQTDQESAPDPRPQPSPWLCAL
jgi:hypothetical protein